MVYKKIDNNNVEVIEKFIISKEKLEERKEMIEFENTQLQQEIERNLVKIKDMEDCSKSF